MKFIPSFLLGLFCSKSQCSSRFYYTARIKTALPLGTLLRLRNFALLRAIITKDLITVNVSKRHSFGLYE